MAKLINLLPKNQKPKTNESLEDMETVSLPTTMERFLDKTIGIIKGYNLPRKKEQLVVAKILDALKLTPSELQQAVQKVKKYKVVTREKTGNDEHDWMGEELNEANINERVGISLTKMDLQVIIKSLKSDKILNPQARKQLIDKLQDLYTGGSDFIDYLG